jgi:chloramphenicol O-acetyltransferase
MVITPPNTAGPRMAPGLGPDPSVGWGDRPQRDGPTTCRGRWKMVLRHAKNSNGWWNYNEMSHKMLENDGKSFVFLQKKWVKNMSFFQTKSWKKDRCNSFLNRSVVRTDHFHGNHILKLKNMKHCHNIATTTFPWLWALKIIRAKIQQWHVMSLNVT